MTRAVVLLAAILPGTFACSRARDEAGGGPPPAAEAPAVGHDSAFEATHEVDSTGAVTPIAGTQGLRAFATPDCAPWDGPAVSLTIDLSKRETLTLRFWGKGLERMARGPASITLDGSVSASGTGMATICPPTGGTAATPCRQVTARVEFEASGNREGSPLRGRAVFRDADGPERTVAFSVVLANPPGRVTVCG